jgi:hypothetical protein
MRKKKKKIKEYPVADAYLFLKKIIKKERNFGFEEMLPLLDCSQKFVMTLMLFGEIFRKHIYNLPCNDTFSYFQIFNLKNYNYKLQSYK